jgi:signal transduction histidine kinase/CheY-like chemotaxis protein
MSRASVLLLAAVVALTVPIFILDLLVHLGVAAWLPYVLVVLLSLWFPNRWQTYATAAACTTLLVLGLFLSPPGTVPFWIGAVNRLLGALTLWVTAVVGVAARRTVQLEEANRRLHQEIAERERLQAQLLRSQRLESIGILAGGIAHDFNNLLTPILMAVKLLKQDRPEDERHLLLRTLQASAERGAGMVRQLLAFAGGKAGQRVTLQPWPIIKEIEAILEHTFPKTIRITVDFADPLQPVHADATQLSQVLMNLCINARDAMPDGGTLTIQASDVRLDAEAVRLYPDALPGSYLLIVVSDTGTGIPTGVLDKVFDPFFTTKGQAKGSGLGLSTALGIVRAHGGFITVQSEVGKGSRFAVYLPTAAQEEIRPLEPEPLEQIGGQGESILVVDDEPLIRETARATLEGAGYRVVTAADGREAVERYRQQPGEIQVVLLDMMMPGMDGRATVAALEALDASVRLILSSGLRVSGRVAETVPAGHEAVLPKPYTDQQLLATLARVLKKERGGR